MKILNVLIGCVIVMVIVYLLLGDMEDLCDMYHFHAIEVVY